MSVPDETGSRRQRKWRRRSLWALIVLAPLTLFEISYDSVKELVRGNDLWPQDVAASQTVQFGGSDWQLVALKTSMDSKPGRFRRARFH